MSNLPSEFASILVSNNIRPTYPRIKVLTYLTAAQTHPTAEEIYNSLIEEIPSLSKSTVYNTLKIFVDVNLVKIVNIEETEMRYDIIMTKHGHFKCEVCGNIYDFPVNVDVFVTAGMDNFKINDKDVIFRGVCPHCLDKAGS